MKTAVQPTREQVLRRFSEAFIKVAPSRFSQSLRDDLGSEPVGVVRPQDREQLHECLRVARLLNCPIVPMGAGTALCVGNPLQSGFLVIDLGALDRVIEYSQADLVVTAQAGMRFLDLQRHLAEHGQWLPVEPPDAERASIGGMVGAAATSLLAHAHGTLRNHLLGIQVVHPDGQVTKAGGRVVKNVAGYDLMKLYHGSLGTLALIEQATLRARPLPEHDVLVCGRLRRDPLQAPASDSRISTSPDLMRCHARLIEPSLNVTSAHLLWSPAGDSLAGVRAVTSGTTIEGGPLLLVRLLGAEAAVEVQATPVRALAAEFADDLQQHLIRTSERLSRPPALRALEDGFSRGDEPCLLQLKISCVPSTMSAVLQCLRSSAFVPPATDRALWSMTLDLLRGLFFVKLQKVEDDRGRLAADLRSLRERLTAAGAVLSIPCVPPSMRGKIPFAEIDPQVRGLHERIKKALDPEGIFSPGRMLDPDPTRNAG